MKNQPQRATTKPMSPTSTAQGQPAGTHEMTGEYLTGDSHLHTLTFKDSMGKTATVKLEGAAIGNLSQLRLRDGDRVTLTCRDDANGVHRAITHIARAA